MIKLIATDLDGTLLMDDHATVSQENLAALKKASEMGIKIVIASGRDLCLLPYVLEQVPFADYAVSSNGATCTDLKSGKTMFSYLMDYEIWGPISDLAARYTDEFTLAKDQILHVQKEYFSEERLDDKFIEVRRLIMDNLKIVDDVRDYLKGQKIEKIDMMKIPEQNYQILRDELMKLPGINVCSSVPGTLEAYKAGTNKGVALKHLCEELSIDNSQVMAFGDAENDKEMLTFAGQSYAMANGMDEAKAAAKEVTIRNSDNGVAVCVNRAILNK